MKPELLNYDALSEFGVQLRDGILDFEHVSSSGLAHFKTLVTVDEREIDNKWCWKLVKDNVTYLLNLYDENDNKRVLKDVLPIKPTALRTVSHQGKVYELIEEHKPVGFQSIKKLSFKQLVDNLNSIPHTNMRHRGLLVMMGLTQFLARAYFRVASPPGLGKDNANATLHHLVGSCGSITNPTVARLEQETVTTRWLAITEITKIPKAKWDEDELFLLDCADHKPTTKKRSKSHGIVGDTLELKQFSVSLFYNDLTNSRNTKRYLDFFADDQLLDRFVPFRLYGTFTHDFGEEAKADIKQFVTENKSYYMDLIYTITWFKNNYNKLRNPYDNSKLLKLSNRERVTMLRLLKTVSFYCDSQAEYDEWIEVINKAVFDYRAMVAYPKMLEVVTEGMSKLGKVRVNLIEELDKMNTFTERLIKLDSILKAKSSKGGSVW